MCGAEVRFADVDPMSGLMTQETLAEALGSGPAKVVLPVHLGGRLCDMAGIALLARAAGAKIVEDACHAVGGADAYGHPVGACPSSDAACFSFHPVKTLAAGEGGMVTLNDPGSRGADAAATQPRRHSRPGHDDRSGVLRCGGRAQPVEL